MDGQFFIASGWCPEQRIPYIVIVGCRGEWKPMIRWNSLHRELVEIGRVKHIRITSDGELSIKGDQAVHSALEVEEGIGYTPTMKAPCGAFRPLEASVFEKIVATGKLPHLANEVAGRTPLIIQWLARFGVMLPEGQMSDVGVA